MKGGSPKAGPNPPTYMLPSNSRLVDPSTATLLIISVSLRLIVWLINYLESWNRCVRRQRWFSHLGRFFGRWPHATYHRPIFFSFRAVSAVQIPNRDVRKSDPCRFLWRNNPSVGKKGKKLDDRSEWRTRICFTLGGRIPPLKRIMPLPSFVRNLKEMFPDFFAIQAGRIFKNKKGYLNYSFFAVFVTDYQVRLARGESDGIQSLSVRTVELQSTDDRDQMTARLGQFQHVQPQRIGHELHLERNVSVTAQLEDQLKMLKDNDRLPFSCSPQSYCALVLRARLVCWCCRRRKRDRSTASWIYRRCDCGRRTLHPPRRTTEYKW